MYCYPGARPLSFLKIHSDNVIVIAITVKASHRNLNQIAFFQLQTLYTEEAGAPEVEIDLDEVAFFIYFFYVFHNFSFFLIIYIPSMFCHFNHNHKRR